MFRRVSLSLFLASLVALSLVLAGSFSRDSGRAEAANLPAHPVAVAAHPDGNCVQVSNTLGSTNAICAGFNCGFFANSCLGGCGFLNNCFGGCGVFNNCFGGCGVFNNCFGGFGGCGLNSAFCNSCIGVISGCALGSCVQNFSCAGTLCGINANCFGSLCGVNTACSAGCSFATLCPTCPNICPNLLVLPAPVNPVPADQIVFSAFPNAATCGSLLDLNFRVLARGGQPVADGTTIGLTTTLGSVQKTVTTDGGGADARLTIDPRVRGTATITATAPNGTTGTKTINVTCGA